MANTRGVFTLQDVRYAQEDEVWVSPDQSFASNITAPPNVGYFGSGYSPSYFSIVDKTNFTSDTTARVPGADLSRNKVGCSGSSNSQAGYFSGGSVPPNNTITDVDKITYSTETSSRSPGSNTSFSAGDAAGANSSSNSYFAGGNYAPGGVPTYSNVDKMSFATEQYFRVPSANLTIARRQIHGFSGTDEMYVAGGYDGSWRSATDKLTFATDTTARIPGADLSQPVSTAAAASNGTIGYVANGAAAPNNSRSFVDKITFATSTRSTLPTNMPVARNSSAGTGNSSDAYFAGGNFAPGGTPVYSSIFKIDYSTDSISTAGGNLSQARRSLAATGPRTNGLPQTTGYVASTQNLKGSASPGFGYWTGGGGNNTNVAKHNFSTDSAGRTPSANLNIGTYSQAAMSNPTNYYSVSGANPVITSAQRVSYASDTSTLIPGAAIGQGVRQTMGLGNMDQGYILGGSSAPGVAYSIVEKLSYSTETSARVPSGDLIQNNTVAGSAGTPSFGVLGGGFSVAVPGRVSYFQKINYSNDTNAQIPSANLPQVNGNLTATGNGYAGYRAGGETPSTISNISRHVYSTDSVNYLPQSLANGSQTNFESNGSVQAAYWGGDNSNVNRMNYSTETGYSLPTSSINQSYMGAASAEEFDMPQPRPETPTLNTSVSTGVPNTGYFGGGASPGAVSTMDKVNYSTDTAEAVPGANLSSSKDSVRAASSTTAGYFGGGSPGPVSTMNKVTYSADTTAAVPGANLTNQRYQATAVMSTTAGYFCGGRAFPINYSFIDKLTFSNDTTAALPSAADLNGSGSSGGSRGNQLAGYTSGGWNYPGMENRTDKLNYSTETTFAVPSAYLIVARYGIRGMSSAYAGYFSGGTNEPTVLSSTERLVYSTDVSAAVPSAPLTSASSDTASTSSLSSGFFLRGSSASLLTSVSKLNFVTETWSESTVQLSQARYAFDATSARDNVVGNVPNIL